MADFPALPLYTDAFLADTSHLDATETGAYLSLLMAAWRAPGCCLPDDPVRLARMARCDTRTWGRIKDVVLAFWVRGEDGMLRQKRLTKTLLACNTSQEKRRRGADAANRKIAERREKQKPDLKLLKNQELIDAERIRERPPERDRERAHERERERDAERTVSISNILSPPNGGSNISSPPYGGADARARDPSPFDEWEAKLRAIEGVEGSGLAISSMAPVAALQRDGYSLTAELIPVLKADIASAQARGRLNRLSWATIAKRVREARQEPAQAVPPPKPVDWASRLANARTVRLWPRAWGPPPNEPGCIVPAEFVHPNDGLGWGDLEDTA